MYNNYYMPIDNEYCSLPTYIFPLTLSVATVLMRRPSMPLSVGMLNRYMHHYLNYASHLLGILKARHPIGFTRSSTEHYECSCSYKYGLYPVLHTLHMPV